MSAQGVPYGRICWTPSIAAVAAIIACALAALGGLASARAECGDPVYSTVLEPDANGDYAAGFMYWTWRELFPGPLMHPPTILLLAKVIEVCPPVDLADLELREYPGWLRVEKVVRCPEVLAAAIAKLRRLYTTAVYDLNVGDRVLVSLIEYEGQLAVPRYTTTNCVLGHRFGSFGSNDEGPILRLLSTERGWQPDSLSFDELRLWARVEPWLVAEYAISRLEARAQPTE